MKPVREARKIEKDEKKRLRKEAEARRALYVLHWRASPGKSTAVGPVETTQYIMTLQDDLKRMEDVSEDAVWYLTKEADDGTHVLLVTANAKHAQKYSLDELPADVDTHSVQLGSTGPVDIPVASLRAMMRQQKEEGSGSEDEGLGCGTAPGSATMTKDEAKRQKKEMKESKEKLGAITERERDQRGGSPPDKAGAKFDKMERGVAAVAAVEEDPEVRQHVLLLLSQMNGGPEQRATAAAVEVGAPAGTVTESTDKMGMAQREDKAGKAERKEKDKKAEVQAKEGCEGEDEGSSSSSSSDSSSSEDED